jgi:1-acyl-sn-glycerol-3-phosphate acyltransferase
MAKPWLAHLLRIASGVRPIPNGALPPAPLIFFANHSSHLDFAIIWAALPPTHRATVRPVAGRDYWQKNGLRRWLSTHVFNAVLIERHKVTIASNPLEPMLAALDAGNSLIVFPEGTRSFDGKLLEFKPGLYHLAHARPTVPLVPIHLDNLNRILPKGKFLAVPLIASLTVGTRVSLAPQETKAEFLTRARHALASLHPATT